MDHVVKNINWKELQHHVDTCKANIRVLGAVKQLVVTYRTTFPR